MRDHPAALDDPGVAVSGLEVRRFRREDEAEVLELVGTVLYPEDFPDFPGYWRWKHYENPFGKSFGLVALAGEKVVAARLFMHWQLCAGGQLLRVGRAVDAAVHPGWRRQGLFQKLTLAQLEPMRADGLVLTFNTPNAASSAGYRKMGWVDLGRLPLRVKVVRPLTAFPVLLSGRRAEVPQPRTESGVVPNAAGRVDNSQVLALLREPAVRSLVEGAGTAQNVDPPPGSAAFRLRTALSPAYLEWHYGRNCWYQYAAAFVSKREAGALVIGRVRHRRGLREALVTEIVASEARHSRALVAEAMTQLARDTQADYLAVAALGQAPGLRDGFVPIGRRGAGVALRVLGPNLPIDPTVWCNWAAGIGDFELF